jgi:hypothetical protein
VAAILTQPDDDGHQHPIAYKSRKLTTTERAYPAHVLELLAVRVFKHYLLGSGASRPAGSVTDFDLLTDNQVVTWLQTNHHLNKVYDQWLDNIADFNFHVTHVPGTRNPSDPLSRRAFADGDGPASTTGDPDPESQQKVFSQLERNAPEQVILVVIQSGRATTCWDAAEVFKFAACLPGSQPPRNCPI